MATPSATASTTAAAAAAAPTATKTETTTSIPTDYYANNPGSYEDLHKKTKEVFPGVFEGFKFTLNKMLSSHFQVQHSISMTPTTANYKFGSTLVGPNQVSPQEAFPIVLGDIDSNGNLNANFIHQYKNIRTRAVAQIQEGELAGYQMTNDFRGRDYTASTTFANNDIIQNTGVIIGHYLQRVNKSLDLGAELVLQYGPNVPNNRMAFYSVGWRYFGGKQWSLSGAINPLGSLHLYYAHQSTSPIQFGVELETNVRTMESACTFGYQVDLNKANLTFKGMIDSNWNVGGVLEKRLLPLPFTLIMSGFINHVKPAYKFGMGLTIG